MSIPTKREILTSIESGEQDMKRSITGTVAAVLVAGILGGFIGYFARSVSTANMSVDAGGGARAEKKAELWTCSMHPQIKLPKQGKCPICFMDLIPLDSDDDDEGGLRELSVSENAAKLMEVETVPVERRFVTAEVRMVGKVDHDETRLAHIPARMPGRIDRLFVNYTGITVRKGDHMAEYYSPELLVAQQELLLAYKDLRAKENAPEKSYSLSPRQVFDSVKKKLELWGLTEKNIDAILNTGKVSDHVTLYAPVSGIVVHRNALEGKYFKTGENLFTISDLSKVWVMLDAYESDLPFLRYGQKVEFTAEAFPGERFSGRISFIEPVLDPKTRTVKVRVQAENPELKLKPEMFVRALAFAQISEGGLVVNENLAGKWISPMHPEVVKDKPGKCDVCGMDIVPAEELGYAATEKAGKPLVVPASAPLLTGKRAVVYLKLPGRQKPVFEGREIELGLRAGDFYVVKSGLNEGDMVLVSGAFKLDAELQIKAKPSMMSPDDEEDDTEKKAPRAGHKTGPMLQTKCPVMGGEINKDFFVDVKGKRIYVCCPGCIESIKKDPDKYIKEMESKGIELEEASGGEGDGQK